MSARHQCFFTNLYSALFNVVSHDQNWTSLEFPLLIRRVPLVFIFRAVFQFLFLSGSLEGYSLCQHHWQKLFSRHLANSHKLSPANLFPHSAGSQGNWQLGLCRGEQFQRNAFSMTSVELVLEIVHSAILILPINPRIASLKCGKKVMKASSKVSVAM